jgi:hypothetical protein
MPSNEKKAATRSKVGKMPKNRKPGQLEAGIYTPLMAKGYAREAITDYQCQYWHWVRVNLDFIDGIYNCLLGNEPQHHLIANGIYTAFLSSETYAALDDEARADIQELMKLVRDMILHIYTLNRNQEIEKAMAASIEGKRFDYIFK